MWAKLLSSVIGSALNKKNPEIQDVKRGESVLSSPSTLQNNSGGNGGFMGALMNLYSDKGANKDSVGSSRPWTTAEITGNEDGSTLKKPWMLSRRT